MSPRVSLWDPAWLEVRGLGELLWEGLEVSIWEGVPCSVDHPRQRELHVQICVVSGWWKEGEGTGGRTDREGPAAAQALMGHMVVFGPSRLEHLVF